MTRGNTRTHQPLLDSQRSRKARQLRVDNAVRLVAGKRTDLQQALVDNQPADERLVEEAASDVAAEVAHRESVRRVGREDDVDVLRPRVGQPRQALRVRLGRQVIDTVDDDDQLLAVREMSGHFVERRLEVLSQSWVSVDLLRL